MEKKKNSRKKKKSKKGGEGHTYLGWRRKQKANNKKTKERMPIRRRGILGSQLEKTTKTKKQTAKNKLITKEDNMRERERERERERRVIPDFGWRIKKKKKQ